MFKFYVLNYDWNKKSVIHFNIFQNWLLDEAVEKEIKKYLRSPSKYSYKSYFDKEDIYGFEALEKRILGLIAWQERGRCEYEICAGRKFEEDITNMQAFDCYEQCEKNIDIITRDCIWQYKHRGDKNES